MKILRVVLSIFIICVSGHAVLTSPTPFNVNPSKTPIAGIAAGSAPYPSPQTTPQYNFQVGNQIIHWDVRAGDGVGALSVYFDTTGAIGNSANAFPTSTNGNYHMIPVKSCFNNNAPTTPLTNNAPNVVGSFTCTITIPTVSCTGTGSTCTLLVATLANNWFSGSTVTVSGSAVGATGSQYYSSSPSTLPFCTGINYHLVKIAVGETPTLEDQIVQQTVNSDLNNPTVFGSPNNFGCTQAYTRFVCALNFPLTTDTGVTGVCYNSCVNALAICGITQAHASLYNCMDFDSTVSDSWGTCDPLIGAANSQLASSFVTMAALFAVALIAFLV